MGVLNFVFRPGKKLSDNLDPVGDKPMRSTWALLTAQCLTDLPGREQLVAASQGNNSSSGRTHHLRIDVA